MNSGPMARLFLLRQFDLQLVFLYHGLITVLPCPQLYWTAQVPTNILYNVVFSNTYQHLSVCRPTVVRQCDPRVMVNIILLDYPDDMATLMSSALLTPLMRMCL